MVAGNFTGFPFAVGSVVGVRAWRFTQAGVLTGITFTDCEWTPGVNEAKCLKVQHTKECVERGWASFGVNVWLGHLGWRPTSSDCTCPTGCGDMRDESCPHGFWLMNSTSFNYGGEILGVIEGFGLTTEGSAGSRCTKAKIVALCLPTTPPVKREFVDDRKYTRRERLALRWKRSGLPMPWSMRYLTILLERDRRTREQVHRWEERTRLYRPGRIAIEASYADKIRANYPDVKIYDDLDAMLADYPLTPPPSKEAPDAV